MNLIQILMTPSEVMNNILLCIFAILESFLFQFFFTRLLHIKASKKQTIVYISFASIIGILTNKYLNGPISYFINLLCFFIYMIIIYKQNIKNSSIAILTTYILIFISAYLSQIFLSIILKITPTDILNIPIYHILTSLLLYSLFSIFYLLIIQLSRIISTKKPQLKLSIIVNLILGIVVILIQSVIFALQKDALSSNLKLIILSSLLTYFLISMYSLFRTNKLEQTSQDLEKEKIYNKTLSILHDNIRCFKHDFDNIVQILGGYIDLNDMNGLKRYYKSLLEECKLTNNLNVLNPQTINNPSIYSLLNNKYYKAANDGVTMNFEIFSDLSKINTNIYELSRILGILLDNSIEAARETDEKVINIMIRSDAKKQIFIVENSCIDNNISTTKIFEKGYSTKENNSGIGLWKVHKILAKNTDIDLFTTVKNNKFTQELSVFYS